MQKLTFISYMLVAKQDLILFYINELEFQNFCAIKKWCSVHMPSSLEHSKFKNIGHLGRKCVIGSSPIGDNLLYYNKILNCW